MSIASTIAYDHEKIAKLFYHIEQLGREETPLRAPFFNKLKKEVLILHRAEEEVLYDALEGNGKTDEIIHRLGDENKTIEQVIHAMEREKMNSEKWHKLLMRLKKLVTHHMRVEEERLLKRAEKTVKPSKSEALEEEFNDFKQEQWKVGVSVETHSIKSDFFQTAHAA